MKITSKVTGLALLPALLLVACGESPRVEVQGSPASAYADDPAAIARGGAIFKSVCSGYCHQMMPTTTDALFLFDCDWKHGDGDDDIFKTISNGVPNSRMMPFADNLPEGYDDTWRVIAWLRESSQCKAAEL